jgi:hypothetical protein
MDRDVFLDHREFWTTESNPLRRDLQRLTAEEQATLEVLHSQAGLAAPRLEQEKLPFSLVQIAIHDIGLKNQP